MVKRKATSAAGTTAKQRKQNGEVNAHAEAIKHRSHQTKSGIGLTLGEGDVGQLGLGPDIMERVKPALVPDIPEDVVQVCAGGMHTVFLTVGGKVFTFGCNDEGALGRLTPEEEDSSAPGQVELDAKIIQVSAGDSHSAALSNDGRVFIWGVFRDANGRIGLTPKGDMSFSPVQILQDQKIKKISSGVDHLVSLTEEGDIFTVGNAEQGQLGRVAECFSNRGGRKGLSLLLNPGRVSCKRRKTKFQDIWTGQYLTYAQEMDDGAIHAWGLNNYYQLGLGDTVNRFVPEKVQALSPDKKWIDMSGGQHHSLALDSDGKVYCLGRKEYGRLGLGDKVESEAIKPMQVPTLSNHKCISVNCGTAVSFAVTDKGAAYAWGMGTSKQLAQKEEDDLWVPTVMEGKQLETRNVLMVSSGGQHTVLLAANK